VIETEDAVFCPHHLRQAETHGEEAVTSGTVPKQRALRLVEVTEPPLLATTTITTPGGNVVPANVRQMLAEAAAENVEALTASLLEAAGSAARPVWLTVECSGCGAQSRVEAPVPDVRARVAAIEVLLHEGFGRPPQAEEAPLHRAPTTVEEVRQMPWPEMQALFAALYVNEIEAVLASGGEALVREKLADLSVEAHRALRRALEEAPA
jgi:hypothetical protein